MAQVRNISPGPRGAYLKGALVNVDPGKTAEADDWNDEWFAPAGETSDTAGIDDLDINGLAELMVSEGLIDSTDVVRDDMVRMIQSKREFEAAKEARDPLDHDHDGEMGGMAEPPLEQASAQDIVAAIGLLDASNDEHWTTAGLPAVDAVREIAGKDVTRAAITEAAPNAKRPETT